MNLRTAHQEQFIFSSRRKIERGEGVFHSPCTLKNSCWMWLFLLKVFYDFPILKGQKKAEKCYFLLCFLKKQTNKKRNSTWLSKFFPHPFAVVQQLNKQSWCAIHCVGPKSTEKKRTEPLITKCTKIPAVVLSTQVLHIFFIYFWNCHSLGRTPQKCFTLSEKRAFSYQILNFPKDKMWAWITWRQKSSYDILQWWDTPLLSLQSSLRNVCDVI